MSLFQKINFFINTPKAPVTPGAFYDFHYCYPQQYLVLCGL